MSFALHNPDGTSTLFRVQQYNDLLTLECQVPGHVKMIVQSDYSRHVYAYDGDKIHVCSVELDIKEMKYQGSITCPPNVTHLVSACPYVIVLTEDKELYYCRDNNTTTKDDMKKLTSCPQFKAIGNSLTDYHFLGLTDDGVLYRMLANSCSITPMPMKHRLDGLGETCFITDTLDHLNGEHVVAWDQHNVGYLYPKDVSHELEAYTAGLEPFAAYMLRINPHVDEAHHHKFSEAVKSCVSNSHGHPIVLLQDGRVFNIITGKYLCVDESVDQLVVIYVWNTPVMYGITTSSQVVLIEDSPIRDSVYNDRTVPVDELPRLTHTATVGNCPVLHNHTIQKSEMLSA